MACSALLKPVSAQVCLWNLRTGVQRRVISAAVAGGSSRGPSAPRAALALGDDAVAATCGRQARCTPRASASDIALSSATSKSTASGPTSCCLACCSAVPPGELHLTKLLVLCIPCNYMANASPG